MHKVSKDIISYEELYRTERGANALLASACVWSLIVMDGVCHFGNVKTTKT